MAGSTVTQPSRAIKPAMVVMELPTTEVRVSPMAAAMASLRSEICSRFSL